MSAAISIVTLAVADIPVATAFYEALGWQVGPQTQESIAFLQGNNIVLALYGIGSVEEEFGEQFEPDSFPHVTLAINRINEDAVDQFFRAAIDAGAEPVKKPDRVFWGGYSGNFRDPDGHMWEVAHNPFIEVDEDGRLDLLSGAT